MRVVLGERAVWREVAGERDREGLSPRGEVIGFGLGLLVELEGDGVGLPEIMEAQRESTSMVEVAAEARGFFSTFLEGC